MKFVYTPGFKSTLNNRFININGEKELNVITIFTCSLVKKDNPHDTNSSRLQKVEVPVNTAIGRLNEDIYVIELDYQSIEDAKYLVDGVQFSRYNELMLYYTNKLGERNLAGWVDINQSNNNMLIDYAKNYIYVDLSPYPINCHIQLQETVSLNMVDKSETPIPLKNTKYYHYVNGKLERYTGTEFIELEDYYTFSPKTETSMSVPGLTLNHKHYLGGTNSLMSSEDFFNKLKHKINNPGDSV